jgi:moderate conductance mechanosensitive channel
MFNFNVEQFKLAETIKEKAIDIIPDILLLLLFSFVSFKVVRLLAKIINKFILLNAEKISREQKEEFEKRVSTIQGIFIGIADAFIWTMIVFFILNRIGFDVRPLLAGAGIIGLAVGFGSQELVRDIISGMFIIFENQIRKGDVAIINGTGGLVERIGLRTITLRDVSGVVHIIQNGKINSISNMTKEWSAMVFDIGVAYKEDVTKVMEIMKKVGDELYEDPEFRSNIVEPLEVMGLDKFADSALIIKARIKTKPIMQWTVGREYRKRLKEAFDKYGIEIPFPHLSVYWGSQSEPFQVKSK